MRAVVPLSARDRIVPDADRPAEVHEVGWSDLPVHIRRQMTAPTRVRDLRDATRYEQRADADAPVELVPDWQRWREQDRRQKLADRQLAIVRPTGVPAEFVADHVAHEVRQSHVGRRTFHSQPLASRFSDQVDGRQLESRQAVGRTLPVTERRTVSVPEGRTRVIRADELERTPERNLRGTFHRDVRDPVLTRREESATERELQQPRARLVDDRRQLAESAHRPTEVATGGESVSQRDRLKEGVRLAQELADLTAQPGSRSFARPDYRSTRSENLTEDDLQRAMVNDLSGRRRAAELADQAGDLRRSVTVGRGGRLERVSRPTRQLAGTRNPMELLKIHSRGRS